MERAEREQDEKRVVERREKRLRCRRERRDERWKRA
jgi:hypothetical protein